MTNMGDCQGACSALQAACRALALPCHLARQLDGHQAFCTLQLPGSHHASAPQELVCHASSAQDGSITAEQAAAAMALQCLADAGLMLPDAVEQVLQLCWQCWQPPPPPPIQAGRLPRALVFLVHGQAHATLLGPPSALLASVATACHLTGPGSPAQLPALPCDTLPLQQPPQQCTHLIELPAHDDAAGSMTAPLVFQASGATPQAAAEAASAYLLLHLHSKEGLVTLPPRLLLEPPVVEFLDPQFCHACHAPGTAAQQQPQGQAGIEPGEPQAAAAHDSAAEPVLEQATTVSQPVPSVAAPGTSQQEHEHHTQAQATQQSPGQQHHVGESSHPQSQAPPPAASAAAMPGSGLATTHIIPEMSAALNHLAAVGKLQLQDVQELQQSLADVSAAQQHELLEEWQRKGVLPANYAPAQPQQLIERQAEQQKETQDDHDQNQQQQAQAQQQQKDASPNLVDEQQGGGHEALHHEQRQQPVDSPLDGMQAAINQPAGHVRFIWVEAVSSGELGLSAHARDSPSDAPPAAVAHGGPQHPLPYLGAQQRLLEAAVVLLDARLHMLHSFASVHVGIRPASALSHMLRLAGREREAVEWLRQRCCTDGSCSLAEAELKLLHFLSSECHLPVHVAGGNGGKGVSGSSSTGEPGSQKGSQANGSASEADAKSDEHDGRGEQQSASSHEQQGNTHIISDTAEAGADHDVAEAGIDDRAVRALQEPAVHYVVCSSDYVGVMSLLATQAPALAAELGALPHIDLRALDMLCQRVMPKACAGLPVPKASLHATQRVREAYCRLRHYRAVLLPTTR